MDVIKQKTRIDEQIYSVRGMQVMIDKDLAVLYGVETKQLNRAVKRNIERFPKDFMFQLTKEECLRCQIGTLNTKQGQHLKYLPYALTEYGIAMLSGILRSETAITANIRIMRAFANMRKKLHMAMMYSSGLRRWNITILKWHKKSTKRTTRCIWSGVHQGPGEEMVRVHADGEYGCGGTNGEDIKNADEQG